MTSRDLRRSCAIANDVAFARRNDAAGTYSSLVASLFLLAPFLRPQCPCSHCQFVSSAVLPRLLQQDGKKRTWNVLEGKRDASRSNLVWKNRRQRKVRRGARDQRKAEGYAHKWYCILRLKSRRLLQFYANRSKQKRTVGTARLSETCSQHGRQHAVH